MNTLKELAVIKQDIQSKDLNKELNKSEAFTRFLELSEAVNDVWTMLKEEMKARGLDKVSGDWGYAKFSPVNTLSAGPDIAPRFMKALDKDLVKAYKTLHKGQLPKGVNVSTYQKFDKHVNKIGA